MSNTLSLKQIGHRLAQLRKQKGLSQEELAKAIKISRSSLAQLELGNRGIDLLEFQRLAATLNFSIDEFMSKNFAVKKESILEEEPVLYSTSRNSTPKFSPSKFKNVLLYILEKCAGKPNVGETVVYKLLYFSDFNYYEIYEEHLTGASYKKLPFGPVPQKIDTILNKMIEKNELKRIKTTFHGFAQTRYLPLIKADLLLLKASEKEVLDRVVDQMSDWSASMISDYSHKDMPWAATDDGKEINYELVFYRELPYSVRVYKDENE